MSAFSKMQEQLQEEVDTAFLYKQLAARQKDPNTAHVFYELGAIEETHVAAMLEKIKVKKPGFTAPGPSTRARWQLKLAKVFGYDFIVAGLANTERTLAGSTIRTKTLQGESLSGFEHNHLRIIEALRENKQTEVSGSWLSRIEGRHKTVGGNALRAAVLGANDGLVSNMSLVMGVAGAAAANTTILITGLAGLMAGAISMSLGEWLSVQSSRELYQRQIALEAEELEASPEQEQKELSLLYQAKGISAAEADNLAEKIMEDKDMALQTLVQEELGIDPEELGGSAWEAAIASFLLFAIGAIIPVLAFIFWSGQTAILLSLAFSVVGLFVIGAAITLFTGRSIWYSGFRQILFGLAAAAVTYGIGTLIGTSIAG
ncbi:MAG TPA: VIT1/CCC1 transporter family protein [Chitinophagaceae bacterium]